MKKQRLLLFSPLAMAVALVAYWLIGFSGQRTNIDLTTAGPVVESSPTDDVETARGQSVDSASALPVSAGGCLTLAQLATHPMFAADAARLDSVAITGPTIASYRGLSARYLEI